MKTIILTILIFVMSIFGVSASKLLKYQNIDSSNFEERINIIHSKVVDLTNIFTLHDIKEFNEVYFVPLKFESSVIKYLQKSVDFQNKIIAVCTMTKLPLYENIKILNCYFILYNTNNINEQLLNRCIFNEFDTDYMVAKQYKNPSLRRLLNKMLVCKNLSEEFKINVRETLNGKWYNDLKKAGRIK